MIWRETFRTLKMEWLCMRMWRQDRLWRQGLMDAERHRIAAFRHSAQINAMAIDGLAHLERARTYWEAVSGPQAKAKQSERV